MADDWKPADPAEPWDATRKKAQPFLAKALEQRMRDISEDLYCAG
jgi:hypothetical protein